MGTGDRMGDVVTAGQGRGHTDLQQIIRGVVQGHDQSPGTDVVGEPGEADEDDGGHVVDDLLFEILCPKQRGAQQWRGVTAAWPKPIPQPLGVPTPSQLVPLAHPG